MESGLKINLIVTVKKAGMGELLFRIEEEASRGYIYSEVSEN